MNDNPTQVLSEDPSVLVESERVARLPQKEREGKLMEWLRFNERATDTDLPAVSLPEIWRKLNDHGINVLRYSRPSFPHGIASCEPVPVRPRKIRRIDGEVADSCQSFLGTLPDQTSESLSMSLPSPMPNIEPLSKSGLTILNAIVFRVCCPFPGSFGGADQSPILYEWMKNTVLSFLLEMIAPMLQEKNSEALMEASIEAWEFFKHFTKGLSNIFSPLDRNCCVERDLPTVTSAAINIFRCHLFDGSKGLQMKLLEGVFVIVERMRDGALEAQQKLDLGSVSRESLSEQPLHSQPSDELIASLQDSGAWGEMIQAPPAGPPRLYLSWILGQSVTLWVVMGIANRTNIKNIAEVEARLIEVQCRAKVIFLGAFADPLKTPFGCRDLDYYEQTFEPEFLANSRLYFRKTTDIWLASDENLDEAERVSKYLIRVSYMCLCESALAFSHLLGNSRVRLVALCIEEMVIRNRKQLLSLCDGVLKKLYSTAATSAIELRDEQSASLRRLFDISKIASDISFRMARPIGPGLACDSLPLKVFAQLLPEFAGVFRQRVSECGAEILTRRIAETSRLMSEHRHWAQGARLTPAPHRPSAHDHEFIDSLLTLMGNGRRMCIEIFNDDDRFHSALEQGLADCINGKGLERPSAVEMLAAHHHRLLKKGGFKKPGGVTELQQELVCAREIFELSAEKDIFEESYRALLAERILSKTSVGKDLESYALMGMRKHQGPAYTTKMESMITDCDISQQTYHRFCEWSVSDEGQASRSLGQTPPQTNDTSVIINTFTHASWPSADNDDLTVDLPPQLSASIDHFSNFYASSFPGRRLKWLFSRGDMEIKVSVGRLSSYVVSVSTLQGLVLAAFDDQTEPMSLSALSRLIGIDNKDLLRTIVLSLCQPLTSKEPRSRLLIRCGDMGSIGNSCFGTNDGGLAEGLVILASGSTQGSLASSPRVEEYRSNPEFSSRVRNLTAKPPIFLTETPSDAVKESVLRSRCHQLEAAIVRCMKANATLLHSELVIRVQQELAALFAPTIADIKRRVEALIEREYLSRGPCSDPTDSTIIYNS